MVIISASLFLLWHHYNSCLGRAVDKAILTYFLQKKFQGALHMCEYLLATNLLVASVLHISKS